MAQFDINQVKGNDRFIAGGAVLLFILSFLHWVSVSSSTVKIAGQSIGGKSAGANLWHAYGWNKTALILVLIAGGIVIARLMGALDNLQLPVGINLLTLALCALASLIFLLRFLFAFKSDNAFGIKLSSHPSYGWYLGLLVSFAMTYFAYLNFMKSGEQLPSKASNTPPPANPEYPPPANP